MSGQSYILLIISVASNEDLFDSIRLPLYIHITMMLLVGLIIHPHILNKPRNIFQDSSIIGVPENIVNRAWMASLCGFV